MYLVYRKHNEKRERHHEYKKCDVGLCIDPYFELYCEMKLKITVKLLLFVCTE